MMPENNHKIINGNSHKTNNGPKVTKEIKVDGPDKTITATARTKVNIKILDKARNLFSHLNKSIMQRLELVSIKI